MTNAQTAPSAPPKSLLGKEVARAKPVTEDCISRSEMYEVNKVSDPTEPLQPLFTPYILPAAKYNPQSAFG